MSVSSYDYTPEDVYVMAKYTRKRISCEWQNCLGPTFLNCWHTFEKVRIFTFLNNSTLWRYENP